MASQLAALLNAGAPICFPLPPSGKISHDQLQQLVTTSGIALQLVPMEAGSANTSPFTSQNASQYVMLLRGDHQAT